MKTTSVLCWIVCVAFLSTIVLAHSKTVRLDIYLSSTCPHCIEAHQFFSGYSKTHPAVRVQYFWVNQDPAALEQLYRVGVKEGKIDFSLPAFVFCHTHWTGFSKFTKNELLNNLEHCLEQRQHHQPTALITQPLQEKKALIAYFNQIHSVVPPAFLIPFIALLHLFNPCSFFYLIIFLSLIFLTDLPYMTLKIGLAMLVGLGIGVLINLIDPMWRYTVLAPPYFRIGALFLAGCLACYAYTISQYLSGRTTFIRPALLILLALFISMTLYVYQQTCTFNLAKLFSIWLSYTASTGLAKIGLYALYLLTYLFIPAILLFVYYIARKKWLQLDKQIVAQSTLTSFSLNFLWFTSLLLMIQPRFITSLLSFYMICLIAALRAWIIKKQHPKRAK